MCMSDGGGGSGDGDRDAKRAEEAKTRYVPRNDVLDRLTPAAPFGDAAAPTPPEDASLAGAAGTVIGRTRLVGDHGHAGQGSGAPSVTPVEPMVEAKTEYLRKQGIDIEPVAGWVVVVNGPGRGGFKPVYVGMNSVGRDAGQRVCLNFGDETISREAHAYITYDEEQRCFFLQHGGKSNLVRLAGQPVLSPVELTANAMIRIGRTTLRFVPCCGTDFSWDDEVSEA
jgi:hypothetical protein